MEVSLFSREVMLRITLLRSTSIRSITERHSLFPHSHTRNPLGSPYGSLSLEFDFQEVSPSGEIRAYHVRVSARVG
jgi:hypothetical protein